MAEREGTICREKEPFLGTCTICKETEPFGEKGESFSGRETSYQEKEPFASEGNHLQIEGNDLKGKRKHLQ